MAQLLYVTLIFYNPNQFSMDTSKPSPIFFWKSSKYTTLWYILACEENTPGKKRDLNGTLNTVYAIILIYFRIFKSSAVQSSGPYNCNINHQICSDWLSGPAFSLSVWKKHVVVVSFQVGTLFLSPTKSCYLLR